MDKETLELILKLKEENDDLNRALSEICYMASHKKNIFTIKHSEINAECAVKLVRDLITPQHG